MNTLVVFSALCAVAFGSHAHILATHLAGGVGHLGAGHLGAGHLGVVGVAPAAVGYGGVWAHGPAPLDANGVVVDTPAVAAAKAGHLTAVAQTRAANHAAGAWNGAHGVGVWNAGVGYAGGWAHGPAPLGPGGVVVDTPAVAAAKAQHFTAVAHATAAAHAAGAWNAGQAVGWNGGYGGGWNGAHADNGRAGLLAYGPAPIGPNGNVVDTPAVAAAKAVHFNAVAHARAAAPAVVGYAGGLVGGYAGGLAGGYAGGLAGGYAGGLAGGYAGGLAGGYAGGLAGGYAGGWAHGPAPLGPGGVVVDTPAVAAAKANHLSALAHATAAAHSAGGWYGAHDDGQWHGEGIVDGAAFSGPAGAVGGVYAAGHGVHAVVNSGHWSPALWGDRSYGAGHLALAHGHGWH